MLLSFQFRNKWICFLFLTHMGSRSCRTPFLARWCKRSINQVYFFSMVVLFLQCGRIACDAERCNSYCNSVCLSVHPSVCPSHAGTLSRRIKIGSCGFHCEIEQNTLVFWYQQWLEGGRRTLSPKICTQTDPWPSEKGRLQPIPAYNVSTLRASEKSSIIANRKSTTSFPTSYRWSLYVTPNSPKGWLKKRICHIKTDSLIFP